MGAALMGAALIGARLRQLALGAAALVLMVAPSCSSDLESPTEVTSLRVLSVQADQPYVQPGDDITLRLTYHDAFGASPRPIGVTWIAGCVDPPGGTFLGCYPHLIWMAGELDKASPLNPLLQRAVAPPELSGQPDAVTFTGKVPEDILQPTGKDGEAPTKPAESARLFIFFMLCPGVLGPADMTDGTAFPLACYDENGDLVGADNFVPGFTEVMVFADDRPNENPPIDGIELDGTALSDNPAEATVVARCPTSSDEQKGCGGVTEECEHELLPLVGDVAETDSTSAGGPLQREVLWVNFYADGGVVAEPEVLISSATTGYKNDRKATWAAPGEAGLVTLWAVVHDSRGGASVTRRYLRVE